MKTILVNEKLILHKENLTLFQYKKEQSILAKLPSKRIKRRGGRKKRKFFVHWETKSFISHFHFPSFFIRKCTLKCIQSWVGSSFCLNSDCWLFWFSKNKAFQLSFTYTMLNEISSYFHLLIKLESFKRKQMKIPKVVFYLISMTDHSPFVSRQALANVSFLSKLLSCFCPPSQCSKKLHFTTILGKWECPLKSIKVMVFHKEELYKKATLSAIFCAMNLSPAAAAACLYPSL